MGKTFTIAVAIVLLTASWGIAGDFEVLADAGLVRAPTPLHIKPGTLVKAEFKSSLKTTPDLDFEADSLFPEKVAAQNGPNVKPRPAVAFRERAAGTMAPPPRVNPESAPGIGQLAESLEQATDMEEELEKDLVISPPPVKVEETERTFKKPPVPSRAEDRDAVRTERTAEQPRATSPTVKRRTPSDHLTRQASQKPIQKVRPLTRNNPWAFPAASHGVNDRNYPEHRAHAATQAYRQMTPPYMTSEPRRSVGVPPSADRFVRDGVTIKLAPAAAPSHEAYYGEDYGSEDVLSAVSDIIGLPFAFISSFF
ncbi:MAG: hypothetical protein RDU20_19685 [Desulfomonilaceae bacterium]|nr:hypothetical protein [Desulfomonilaceae bacterium]